MKRTYNFHEVSQDCVYISTTSKISGNEIPLGVFNTCDLLNVLDHVTRLCGIEVSIGKIDRNPSKKTIERFDKILDCVYDSIYK